MIVSILGICLFIFVAGFVYIITEADQSVKPQVSESELVAHWLSESNAHIGVDFGEKDNTSYTVFNTSTGETIFLGKAFKKAIDDKHDRLLKEGYNVEPTSEMVE